MKTWLVLISLGASALAAPLRSDQFWAAKAGEVSQEMSRFARLALQRSHDPSVLAEASKLVDEGELHFHRLAIVAENQGFPLSTGPTAAQQQEFEALFRLNGPEFDRAFLEKEQHCATALNLCRSQALARSRDLALTQALRGLELEAATR